MNETRLIFLVAPVRSGSTFLRLMLDAHPEISDPGEFDFLFDLVTDSGDVPESAKYIRWLEENRIFRSKQLEVDDSLGYPALIGSFIQQLEQEDCVLVLNVHRHFDRIPYLFPEALYIHLLRDPRDVARSAVGMGWAGDVYHGVDIWLEAEQSWDRLKRRLGPEQFIEIKYEEVLEDVQGSLARICDFARVKYTDRMLDYAENSTYELPDKSLSYQWKRTYSQRELRFVEAKLGGFLKMRGYLPSGIAPVYPGPAQRAGLLMRNKYVRVGFEVRKYGFRLYLEGILTRRVGWAVWKDSVRRRVREIDIKGLK